LGIVVGVVIDDARSDHQTVSIQNPSCFATYLPDPDDTPATDSDVTVESRYSGTVNDLSVFDY
jgi:hypothetical protein